MTKQHMTKRAVKFVSAVAASLISGAPLATPSQSAPSAVQDCLAQPNEQTPSGNHWYYRIDRATKRHCWYLRSEREGFLKEQSLKEQSPKIALSNAPAFGKSSASTADNAIPPSVADARAELTAPSIEQTNQPNTPAPAMMAGSTAVSPNSEMQPSVVASRWPDQSIAEAQTKPKSIKNDPVDVATSVAQNQKAPALAVEQFAAAELPPGIPGLSLQMILLAILAALGFAAFAGRAIFKFASSDIPKRAMRRETGVRQIGFGRKPLPASKPVDRATEFFAQLARQNLARQNRR